MHRHALRATTVATVCLLALALLPAANAHPAGVPSGYTRYAHDCADDYGPHGAGVNTQTAHDGIAIDVIEKNRGDDELVYFRFSLSNKAATNNDDTRETLTFVSPGLPDTAQTTMDSSDEATFTVVSGETTLTPDHINGPLAVVNTDGSTDTGRFGYELGYTYETLNATRGQQITDIQLVTLSKGPLANSFSKGDHVPGGTYSAGDYEAGCEDAGGDADYFVAGGYTLTKGPAPADDGDDGGNGGGSGNQGGDGGIPQASFSFSPERPREGDSVAFADSSVDPDGTIVSWAWDFGDGDTSDQQNPTHMYDVARTYVVRLTVTDDDGNTANATRDVRFENQRPIAAFDIDQDQVRVGQEVTFTDQSTDADGAIASWAWDFGDGQSAGGQNVTHSYDDPGTYTVTLTVTDAAGARSSSTETIVVTAAAEGDDTEAAPAAAPALLLLSLVGLAAWRRRA